MRNSRPRAGALPQMRTLETVDRALLLLLAFDAAEERELSVAALASRLDIHRSSASRLAATLAQRGFLERAPGSESFRLGPALGRLGLLAMGGRGLMSESREVMERLAHETRETVVLSVLEGGETVDVAQANGPHLVGMRDWIGRRSPLHASSDGKVFLAFAGVGASPPSTRLAALTERTITDGGALAEEIDGVRRRGWASVEGEFEEGLNGLAAPVFDGAERCVAAISVSGPAYRLPPERVQELAAATQRAAAEIGSRLGLAATPAAAR
jgi:DNA-binding IclR family transcriptional regulator